VVKEIETPFKIARHEFLQEINLYKARRNKEWRKSVNEIVRYHRIRYTYPRDQELEDSAKQGLMVGHIGGGQELN
jgi:hypothetical protein